MPKFKGIIALLGIASAGLVSGLVAWLFTQNYIVSAILGLIVLCLLLQRATAAHTKILRPH